jgi:ElaB/YqjD/DUF883 family membrane-anchored ribosome-binding protein
MSHDATLIDAIRQRLTQQLEYYRLVAELSSEERAAIAASDEMALLKVLNRKQKYLDKLEALRKDLNPLRLQWETVRDRMDASVKAEFKRLTDETESLLKSIIETEQKNMVDARVKKDDASKKVTELKYTANAARSYMGAQPKRAVFDTTT